MKLINVEYGTCLTNLSQKTSMFHILYYIFKMTWSATGRRIRSRSVDDQMHQVVKRSTRGRRPVPDQSAAIPPLVTD